MSLAEKLDKIKSPKLQNQHHTAVVLSAVEDTLRDQQTDFTATAYFAALLALLSQAITTSKGIINKDLATSVVYLLDITAPEVPPPLLRSKFSQILTNIAPALTNPEADAPLLRPSIGCLETLLLAQDAPAWALPQTQVGPRRATAGLLNLAVDHRPKVRKRAQDALTKVLNTPPPSPSLDHPAADMCAETALRGLSDIVNATSKDKKHRRGQDNHHEPGLMHALQLVKTIAAASGGWPSKKIEPLCEVLMSISRSSNEYIAMGAFDIFEVIFMGMADEFSSSKLPRLMDAILELKPPQNDSQLLPPWIAVLARGYDVSAQISPDDTFQKLPELFELVAKFLASPSHNIRVSASECLISFLANCIPDTVILEPSIYDEKVFEKVGKCGSDLLAVKYQSAWMEVFNVLGAMFDVLKWRSSPVLSAIVKTVGELRENDSFHGKKEADELLGKAIHAMGPEAVLAILPLNLSKPKAGQPGRAWLLPILRDHVFNTNLAHFRSEFVPLSEVMFQRVLDHGEAEKTMEIKIFETLVQQIWALLPGYCDLPLDVTQALDQGFAELVSNLLYKQTELRVDACKALQNLVESNQTILLIESETEDMILQRRVSKTDAQKNIDHLASFAGNLLAVLFNVYSETLPQYRGYILQCINAYLSITPEMELTETFTRVTTMLESSLPPPPDTSSTLKPKQPPSSEKSSIPPTSHTLMDLIITISIHLPPTSFSTLFSLAALILTNHTSDPQLIKKAYKLIPRLATSPRGALALSDRNSDLQALILSTADKTPASARRDRLLAIHSLTTHLPPTDLHFIPSILSECVLACKEANEKAREAAFELLLHMARTIANAPAGTVIRNSQVAHMSADAPDAAASLEEFFTMVSAGLAGGSTHTVAASVSAMARLLFEFHTHLSKQVLADLVETVELFLESKSREIVRAVLGFVKVVVVLDLGNGDGAEAKWERLVPKLMVWSHEHKGRLRSKVKGILERLVRRFGAAKVEGWVDEADRKVVVGIRKERERRKRKKKRGNGVDGEKEDGSAAVKGKKQGTFESEFDEAIQESDSDSIGDGSDVDDDDNGDVSSDDDRKQKSKRNERGGKQYIRESSPASSPLDLLAPNALASISSTRPVRFKDAAAAPAGAKGKTNRKVRLDQDGKLVFGRDATATAGGGNGDVVMTGAGAAADENENAAGGGGGVNAYVDAVSGPDAVRRGQKGRLKMSSANMKKGGESMMELDEDEERDVGDQLLGRSSNGGAGRGGGRGWGRGTLVKANGTGKGPMQQRKGLGVVGKSRGSGGGSRGGGRVKGRVEKNRGRRGGGRFVVNGIRRK